jgi:hypothetical protein
MKQTAVEWLVETIENNRHKLIRELFVYVRQAKEMEKEQICDAFYHGVDVDSFCIKNPYTEAEKYYNETFKKEEQ